MATRFLNWAGAAIDLVYPRQCLHCESTHGCHRFSFLCDDCFLQTPRIVPPFCEICSMPYEGAIEGNIQCPNCSEMNVFFDRAIAVMRFRGVIREAIHQFKYGNQLHWRKVLQQWFWAGYLDYPELQNIDLILPVPLHPVRFRTRGFNQARILIEGLKSQSPAQIHILEGCLSRVRETVTQTDLDRSERMKNLEGAFQVRKPHKIEGKKLLLVDDVLTTGSTVNECAKILKKAGATSVLVFTLARG